MEIVAISRQVSLQRYDGHNISVQKEDIFRKEE